MATLYTTCVVGVKPRKLKIVNDEASCDESFITECMLLAYLTTKLTCNVKVCEVRPMPTLEGVQC
jgi:hypothetical protein